MYVQIINHSNDFTTIILVTESNERTAFFDFANHVSAVKVRHLRWIYEWRVTTVDGLCLLSLYEDIGVPIQFSSGQYLCVFTESERTVLSAINIT